MLAMNFYKWQRVSFLLIEKYEKLLQTSSSYFNAKTFDFGNNWHGKSFFFSSLRHLGIGRCNGKLNVDRNTERFLDETNIRSELRNTLGTDSLVKTFRAASRSKNLKLSLCKQMLSWPTFLWKEEGRAAHSSFHLLLGVEQCCPQAAQQAKLSCHPHTGAAETQLGQALSSCPPAPNLPCTLHHTQNTFYTSVKFNLSWVIQMVLGRLTQSRSLAKGEYVALKQS